MPRICALKPRGRRGVFRLILDRLSDGSVHLTAVSLLAPHLTLANHAELLDAARHKTKREVEQLVAHVRPQQDVPSVVRKLPVSHVTPTSQTGLTAGPPDKPEVVESPSVPSAAPPPVKPPEIKPLAPERFKVQFTVGRDTCDKLRQAQDLLRHTIPSGDPAAIFDRALTLLVAELSKRKSATTDRPRQVGRKAKPGSRYVRAAIKREVWRRDGGRCAFRGEQGRCRETGFLEFHHVVPYSQGGPTTSNNLELRCRTHNVYEAGQYCRHIEALPLVRETAAVYGDDVFSGWSGPS